MTSDEAYTGDTEQAEGYWMVYIYDPDDPSSWTAIGLVEDRDEWQEWWPNADLPEMFDGWWCSDRYVSLGLDGGASA